ncbi:MAG TPA: nicotinamide-nucleotide amidase [Thiolapillus brandeum]|uniref:Nicotinamide-nucleotide amidase n=1 Tax=Thiolapillus brandeum TaxID=1076588 RepID=A0A831K9D9_9GAMM|nr:nicotinamide-nucleotide amidase [Thiolapillus brandeum]
MQDAQLEQLAIETAHYLTTLKLTMTTAESCTGGWIAKLLTDIPGASAWFERGFVTYSNQSKIDMLGVRADTLKFFGAVSEQVVLQMAQGALANSPADISIAVSGIAGPGGGSPSKPVGTVWMAWANNKGAVTERCWFAGNREAVRRQTVIHALQKLEIFSGKE